MNWVCCARMHNALLRFLNEIQTTDKRIFKNLQATWYHRGEYMKQSHIRTEAILTETFFKDRCKTAGWRDDWLNNRNCCSTFLQKTYPERIPIVRSPETVRARRPALTFHRSLGNQKMLLLNTTRAVERRRSVYFMSDRSAARA